MSGTTALGLCRRYALVAYLGATAVLSGCSTGAWLRKTPLKYETVANDQQRDRATAKAKHAEALALLDKAPAEKHLAKAETALNEALVADVRYGPAHNSLGMVYYLQNKLYLAAWEFEYAVKLMPGHAQPYNNLGLVYERAGKLEEAISYYSMALSHNENDPQVVGNLVRARLTMGDRGSDLKTMISDLALNHPDPVWQQWARDQSALGKFEDSAKGLEQPWQQSHSKLPEGLPAPIRDEDGTKPPGGPQIEFPESVAPGRAVETLEL